MRSQIHCYCILSLFCVGWFGSCKPSATSTKSADRKTAKSDTSSPDSTSSNQTAAKTLSVAPMKVLQNGQMRSLVDIVKSSGKSLGVFQFSGVTCESCKVEGPHVLQQLAPNSSKILFQVIFPNEYSQYTPAEYQGFTQKYAANSPYVVDSDLSVLKHIRTSNSQYFGLYILLRTDGTGEVLTHKEAYRDVAQRVTAMIADATH